jgi:hypothetical protein
VRARAGVGARIGAATLTGKPDPLLPGVVGGSVTGLSGGPFARVTVGVDLAKHVAVEASAEPGYHVFAVGGTVNMIEQIAVDGAWLSAQVGLGWSW